MVEASNKISVAEYVKSLNIDELETAAYLSSSRLTEYLCAECESRYKFPYFRIDLIDKIETESVLSHWFCCVSCMIHWILDNKERLEYLEKGEECLILGGEND